MPVIRQQNYTSHYGEAQALTVHDESKQMGVQDTNTENEHNEEENSQR